jgi:PucR C-terminal helix-turn-helix domain/GGDEF-like domain
MGVDTTHRRNVTGQGGTESLAEAVKERVTPLTDRLVLTILEQNPGYRTINVVPEEDLRQSCHDNITGILQLLVGSGMTAGSGDPAQDSYFDAARATGQRRAEQGLPLDDVLRSFRLGGRLIWEALIEQARLDGDVDVDELLDVGSRVWEVVDRASAQVAASFHATERDRVRAHEQRKVALWEGLLSGAATDPVFAHHAAHTVGLPENGPYVVVSADLHANYDEITRHLRSRLSGRGVDSAWHWRSDLVVGLVALRRHPLGTALDVLRRACAFPVGVSLVVSGLAEIEAAHRQAMLALRTLTSGRSEVVALQDRMPEAILIDSPELSERLVQMWLGPLLALSEAERIPLLQTLECWVASAGSTTRTAETVHCHRNTVINRIRRIEAVTRRDLSTERIPVELTLALRANHLLNPTR